jgi:hypothetical protein
MSPWWSSGSGLFPFNTRFTGSNPAEDGGFLRAVKIRRLPSEGK